MNAQKQPVRHRGGVRRIALVLVGLVVVVFILIALAPAFVNMGLGHGFIEGKIDDAVVGKAQFRSISASWFGEQMLTGVTITHASGQKVADVNATLRSGLWPLITGGVGEFDVVVTGTATTDIRKDGSISILEATAPPVPSTEPLESAFRIDFGGVAVTINDEATGRTMMVKPEHGWVRIAPGGVVEADVAAAIESDVPTGAMKLTMESRGLPVLLNTDTVNGFIHLNCESDVLPVIATTHADRLTNVSVTIDSDNLNDVVAFVMHSTVHHAGAAAGQESPLEIDLIARQWIAADGTVKPNFEQLAGRIHARQAPTAMLQPLLADSGIVLERDIGALADIEVTLPQESGQNAVATIHTDQVDVNVRGTLGEQSFNIDTATIAAAISPGLRQQYLKPINPLLADIRHTKERLVATIGPMQVPLDGDLSKLNGDLSLNIGDVQFDSGSLTLAVLSAFNQPGTLVPANIEPIKAKIAGGVLTYDTFALQIDRFRMNYTGAVNLIDRSLDLRTEIPLANLAAGVSELRGYADQISVPIVTRGSFDKPETKVDPNFDIAKAAAEAGIRGGLNDLLKDQGKGLGGLLDDLLGGKKKDGGG